MRLLAAAAVVLLSFALYLTTLAPTVTLVDSGELLVAVARGGVAHPPGFPTYLLLARLAEAAPWGSVATRVHLFSALAAALAAGFLALAAGEVAATPASRSSLLLAPMPTAISGRERKRKRREVRQATPTASAPIATASAGAPPMPASWEAILVLLSGLLLAFSHTLWSYATLAEVYALNTALLAAVLWLLLARRRRDLWLYAAAALFGLALGVHHVTVGLALPAFAALILATDGASFFRRRKFAVAVAVAAAACAAVYAYLPWAASRSPVLNWGNPSTLERLWWHLTGRQYQVYLDWSLATVGRQAGEFLGFLGREFGPPWVPLALALSLIGFVALWRRERALAIALALLAGVNLAYTLGYEIAEDKDAYHLPIVVGLALAAALGGRVLLERCARWRATRPRLAWGGALLLAALPLLPLTMNFRACDESRDWIARDYVDNLLSTVAPGGLVLTQDWQVASPWLYVREIEQVRRDAVLLDINLMRRSWYLSSIEHSFPAVAALVRSELAAYREDLEAWEKAPDLYQRNPALNRRIGTRFTVLLRALVERHPAPVYITADVLYTPDATAREFAQALPTSHELVPQGLVFELSAKRGFREPTRPSLSTRGLADGTVVLERDDVARLKVLPVYLTMLTNRGRYFEAYGHRAEAAAAYREALSLDPNFAPARQALAAQEVRSQS